MVQSTYENHLIVFGNSIKNRLFICLSVRKDPLLNVFFDLSLIAFFLRRIHDHLSDEICVVAFLFSALDLRLALYAQPGRYVDAPKPTEEECVALKAALDVPVPYVGGEPPEHRMLKNIVAKMREDMRAYIADGGDVAGYFDFLDERQSQEREFREKALDTVYRAPESLRERAWLGVNARLKDMGIEPLSRPNGIQEIPSEQGQ